MDEIPQHVKDEIVKFIKENRFDSKKAWKKWSPNRKQEIRSLIDNKYAKFLVDKNKKLWKSLWDEAGDLWDEAGENNKAGENKKRIKVPKNKSKKKSKENIDILFAKACENGVVDELGHILAVNNSIDVNNTIYNGTTPLNIACKKGYFNVVNVLLGLDNIDVNKADKDGWTPLNIACQFEKLNIVKALIQSNNIDVNKADKDGWTPLNIACEKGNTGIVNVLLGLDNIDVNKANDYGQTPLYNACDNNKTDIVEALLDINNIDVNKVDKYGKTPLYNVCKEGYLGKKSYLSVVELLLTHEKIEVNKTNKEGETPLLVACLKGHTEIVKALLDINNIEVNKDNNSKATPLLVACLKGHTEIVKALLDINNIEVNKTNKEGETPLLVACLKGHTEIVKALLDINNIDVNKDNNSKATPLYYACQKNNTDIVQALLQSDNIDVNKSILNGTTSLYYACKEGHTEIVEALLKSDNIDVDKADDDDGWTPLHIACFEGHGAIVKLLLESDNIDVNSLTNKRKETPFIIACRRHNNGNNYDIVELLLSKDSLLINKSDDDGKTALYKAVAYKRINIIELLLSQEKKRILINKFNNNGKTALYKAVENKQLDIVKLLVSHDNFFSDDDAKDSLIKTFKMIVEYPEKYNMFFDFLFKVLFEKLKTSLLECLPGLLKKCINGMFYGHYYHGDRLTVTNRQRNYYNIANKIINLTPSQDFTPSEDTICTVCNVMKGEEKIESNKWGRELIKTIITKYSNSKQFRNTALNYENDEGYTPLTLTIYNNQKQTTELLLEYGETDVNKKSIRNGNTALHIACSEAGKEEIVNILLKQEKINVNSTNSKKQTALHLAVINSEKSIVSKLIEWGNKKDNKLNIAPIDKDGQTPLDISCILVVKHRKNQAKIAAELIENGAKYSPPKLIRDELIKRKKKKNRISKTSKSSTGQNIPIEIAGHISGYVDNHYVGHNKRRKTTLIF